MRTALTILSVLFVETVSAEPKQLVCDQSGFLVAERLENRIMSPELKGNEFNSLLSESTKNCINNAQVGGVGVRKTYIFDTKDLSNSQVSKVEEITESCVWVRSDYNSDYRHEEISQLSTTTITLAFKTGNRTFNVDRKTLKAGYGTDRSYTCKLEDVDTSENLI